MVELMKTLNSMQLKIIKNNISHYILFGVSIIVAIAMLGAQGVLQFSETVTSVLLTDGSTYAIAKGMYALSIIALACFLIYADKIYLKYKMPQMGIFLALGIKQKDIKKMMTREFSAIYIFCVMIGLILVVPISWGIWSILSLFIYSTETNYQIGIMGFIIVGIFAAVMWAVLLYINNRSILKQDIIKAIKASHEREIIKEDQFIVGFLGMCLMPLGIILFNICETSDGIMKHYAGIFLVIFLVGMYLFCIQITCIGDIFKRFSYKTYIKNIFLFNIIKQKGKQYVLAIFIASSLIAVTIFGICFNMASFIEMIGEIKGVPYDYSILVNDQIKELTAKEIQALAEGNNVEISDLKEIDFIYLARQYDYGAGETEWGITYITNETSFSKLTTEHLSVPQGEFAAFAEEKGIKNPFKNYAEDENYFYNPTTKEEFQLKMGEQIRGKRIINSNGSIDRFIIMNDKDYEDLSTSVDEKYVLKYYLFNGAGTALDSDNFHKQTLDTIVNACDGKITEGYFSQCLADKVEEISETSSVMDYESNRLYAARWWDLYPFSRSSAVKTQIEACAVYILLILFISLITFGVATMVIAIKVITTIWNDQQDYRIINNLGLKHKELKKIMSRQIALIYFTPAIVGSFSGILMINQIMVVSAITRVTLITIIACGIAVGLFIIQSIIYIIMRNKMLSKVLKRT